MLKFALMFKPSKLLILFFALIMFFSAACSNNGGTHKDIENSIVIKGKSITNKLHVPTLVFYYVDWCPYCKQTKPAIKKAIKLFSDKVFIYKVDMESEEGKDLINKFIDRSNGIGTPYMQFYDSEGKLVIDYTGPMDYKELTKKIWDVFSIKV